MPLIRSVNIFKNLDAHEISPSRIQYYTQHKCQESSAATGKLGGGLNQSDFELYF